MGKRAVSYGYSACLTRRYLRPAAPHNKMNLLRVLATVSSMTFISRVLGFLRDAIIARVFGAG